MMGMMGNKSFAQVLLGKEGKPMMGQKEESDSINPNQMGIDASKEIIKAIKSDDPERFYRGFKILMDFCNDQMESEEVIGESEGSEDISAKH